MGGNTNRREADMATQITEGKHHLSGDWTISEVTSKIDDLSDSLKELTAKQGETLHVDCSKIGSVDMSGLQLLHVWLQCARMRGIRTQLINLPECMRQTIQRLGLQQAFTDNYPDAA